jgi:uncharacterized protein (TIGR02145 family)
MKWSDSRMASQIKRLFFAFPAGYYNSGSYYNLGDNANFWSASEYDATNAWNRNLNNGNAGVNRNNNNKSNGNSCRCLPSTGIIG